MEDQVNCVNIGGGGGEGRERKGEGMLSRKNSKLKISAIVGNASENHFIIL